MGYAISRHKAAMVDTFTGFDSCFFIVLAMFAILRD